MSRNTNTLYSRFRRWRRYRETVRGLRSLGTVWAHHVSTEFKRRFYSNWKKSAQLAFTGLGR